MNIHYIIYIRERLYRNSKSRRPLYRSTMYLHQEGAGCTGGETEKERKCRASRDRTMELVYHGSQFLPPHLHTLTHTGARAHTCHVLLLFITIIVTTGIVFVQFKSIGHRSLQKKKIYIHTKLKNTHIGICISKLGRCLPQVLPAVGKYHIFLYIETLTTILFQNIVVLGFNFTQCNMRLEHGARTL